MEKEWYSKGRIKQANVRVGLAKVSLWNVRDGDTGHRTQDKWPWRSRTLSWRQWRGAGQFPITMQACSVYSFFVAAEAYSHTPGGFKQCRFIISESCSSAVRHGSQWAERTFGSRALFWLPYSISSCPVSAHHQRKRISHIPYKEGLSVVDFKKDVWNISCMGTWGFPISDLKCWLPTRGGK